MATYYAKRALEILREEGVVEFSKAFKRFLFRQFCDMKWMLQRRYYHSIKYGGSSPDPLRLIYVDPDDVEWYLLASNSTDWSRKQTIPDEVEHLYNDKNKGAFRRRKNIGRIAGGDWDKYKKSWDENGLYQSLREVFAEGKDWKETEFVNKRLEIIEIKGSTYGYETKDGFLNERTKYIEKLYKSIDEEGYLTQEEAPDDHRNSDILHEVSVNIGRNGELIFNNRSGHHRLSLAKILNLDKIPVIVIVRHQQWQNIREDVYRNGLTEQHRELCDHPDLQDILE